MIKNAIIFAAGKGKRFTYQKGEVGHKSLLSLVGKTVIEHIIDNLLLISDLKKIVIVVGHHKELFLFLIKKYSQLILVFNSCFDKHKTGCALWKIKSYLLNSDILFFVAGDMLCYQNYFLSVKDGNQMCAIKKLNLTNQKFLAYKLNDQDKIIGADWSQQKVLHVLGEFSVLCSNWSQALYVYLENNRSNLKSKEIYQILISVALQNDISLSMHKIISPGPSDVDVLMDWNLVKKIFMFKK